MKKLQFNKSQIAWAGFLALWFLPPGLYRAIILFTEKGRNLPPASISLGLFIGFLQDSFLLLEFAGLILLLHTLIKRARAKITAGVAVGLFIPIQLYYFSDLLLFLETGLKMDFSFLAFFLEADVFLSSVKESGLVPFLLAIAVFLLLIWPLWKLFELNLRTVRESYGLSFGVLGAVAAVVLLIGYTTPLKRYYRANNPALMDQHTLAKSLVRPRKKVQARELDFVFTPQAEDYEKVSPEYPILKFTKGFHGEKVFDIRVGADERPHVIFLFLESFRAKDVGVLGGKHGATPCFDKLAQEGILFRNFYANGVQTTRAVLAALYGIHPRILPSAVQAHFPDINLIGVPHLFKSRGYVTSFFHNGSLTFERKKVFFPRHGFDEIHGGKEMAARFPEVQKTSWGPHDEYLMRFSVDWLQEQDRKDQPAYMVMFTISNHHPWKVPQGFAAPEFIPEDGSQYPHYLQSVHYSDHSLGLFIELLKKYQLDRKTVLFILADTSQPMGEHNQNFLLVKNLYEENLRIPFLILAPGRIDQPVAVDSIASQVDIMPTVMDIFSFQGFNHAEGSTLRRRAVPRQAFSSNPFELGYISIRQDNYKFIYTEVTKALSLYDLARDPDEQHNLAAEHPELVKEFMRQRRAHITLHMDSLYPENRFAEAQLLKRLRLNPKLLQSRSAIQH